MKQPILYIICGLSFSGKSFISNKIAKYTGSELLSYDQLWLDKKEETGRDIGWEELSSIAYERIGRMLSEGNSIIYDTLNDTVANRDVLRLVATKNNGRAIVIYTNTPLAIIRKRQRKNQLTGERHSVTDENFQKSLNQFEVPKPFENPIEFTPSSDIQMWLSELKNKIIV
jgi:predicted kinase